MQDLPIWLRDPEEPLRSRAFYVVWWGGLVPALEDFASSRVLRCGAEEVTLLNRSSYQQCAKCPEHTRDCTGSRIEMERGRLMEASERAPVAGSYDTRAHAQNVVASLLHCKAMRQVLCWARTLAWPFTAPTAWPAPGVCSPT